MLDMKKEVRDIKRFRQIVEVLAKNGFGYYFHKISTHEKLKLGIKKHKKPTKIEVDDFPKKLVSSLEELGGAFIKLGQLLSLRPDLVPERYCKELSRLQDNVTAFTFSQAKQIIGEELSKPISEVFLDFSKKPIAAASIGQVYLATTKDEKKVVVKVQRPDARKTFESDIDILYFIARMFEKHMGKETLIKPTVIVKEFEEYSKKELDYVHEAKNIEMFYNNFLGTKVKIPLLYWKYTSSRVLCMEYIEGVKLSEAKLLDDTQRKIIASTITNAIYKQVFVDGFFHADPHPGNILLLANNEIAFIDFGIAGYLSPKTKDLLADLFSGIVNSEIEQITKCLLAIGDADEEIDEEAFTEDVHETFSKYYNVPLEQIRISNALHDVVSLTDKYQITIPKNLILFIKCAITTESVVLDIDPSFNPIKHAKPFVEQMLAHKFSPSSMLSDVKRQSKRFKRFIFDIPDISNALVSGIMKTDKGVNRLHNDIHFMTTELDKSSNRVSMSLIITALLISSALIVDVSQPIIFDLPLYSAAGILSALVLSLFLFRSIMNE